MLIMALIQLPKTIADVEEDPDGWLYGCELGKDRPGRHQ